MKPLIDKLNKSRDAKKTCTLTLKEVQDLIAFFIEVDENYFELNCHKYALNLASKRYPVARLEPHEDGGVLVAPLINLNNLPIGTRFYLDPGANSIMPEVKTNINGH
jgi:hypothetical protein